MLTPLLAPAARSPTLASPPSHSSVVILQPPSVSTHTRGCRGHGAEAYGTARDPSVDSPTLSPYCNASPSRSETSKGPGDTPTRWTAEEKGTASGARVQLHTGGAHGAREAGGLGGERERDAVTRPSGTRPGTRASARRPCSPARGLQGRATGSVSARAAKRGARVESRAPHRCSRRGSGCVRGEVPS